jgi:hypothetical protein
MPLGAFKINSIARAAAAPLVRTAKSISQFGNTAISTAQSKFGGSSVVFDGDNDGLTANNPNAQSDVLMAGDYTYECWVYITSFATYRHIFVQAGQNTGNQPGMYINASGKVVVLVGAATAFTGTTSTVSINTWTHLALVRSSGVVKAYVNGTADASTYSNSGAITGGTDIHIGRYPGDSTTMLGHIDEFRVSNTARYTSNFTAPASEFINDSNTVLLFHANGINGSTTFIDDVSDSTFTLTASGGVTSVNEGSSLTFNVTGVNITNGTYYWTVTNSGDFETSSGSFTITSNSGSFSVTPTADVTAEGAETFQAQVRTVSTSGTVVATSTSITINDTSAPAPLTLTFVASSFALAQTTIAMPSGAQVGDIVFVIDRALGSSASIGQFRTPLSANGNSFTEHQTTSGGSTGAFTGCRISSKVLVSGEVGTITNLINNTNNPGHRAIALAFRPSVAITSTSYTSTGGQYTASDPSVQTVAVGAEPAAAMAMAVYHAQAAVSPRTSSITMSEIVYPSATTFYVKYKLYSAGESRTNFTVDMDDEGTNLLQSFYVKFN